MSGLRMKVRDSAAVCAALVLALGAGLRDARAGTGLVCGTGMSLSTDARAAGVEAATKAKQAMGAVTPKVVLVHHSGALFKGYAHMLDGVTSVFDKSIVYGCGAYAALTHESNNAHVSVLALGGDIGVNVAVAKTAGKADDVACGRRLGESLKQAAQADAVGRVLVLFGDCHIPRNDQVVKGLRGVLGDAFPIIGAAAYQSAIYVKGQRVTGSNLALLVTGPFVCGFSLKKDMSREGLVTSARDCVRESVTRRKGNPALVLVFDCGGRRGAMLKHKNFPDELAAMKAAAGNTPIFGFYGSGEMGPAKTGAPAKGVGYHIAACTIFVE